MDSLSIQAVADLINASKGDEDDDSEVCLSDRFYGDVIIYIGRHWFTNINACQHRAGKKAT